MKTPVAGRRVHRRALALSFVVLVPSACSRRDAGASNETAPPVPSAAAPSAEAPPASARAAVPAAAPSSWFAGTWTGTYKASAHRIDLPTERGGIPDWKTDDGKAFVGTGTLELTCSEDGIVSGSARGVLGEQDVTGEAAGDSLQARLVPRAAGRTAFAGTFSVSRAGADGTGDLRASSSDGRVARTASVVLTRSTGADPKAR